MQSARQFWKKLTGVLKSISFKGGDIDPCLLFKKTERGLVLIGLYLDDLLIIRDDADIDEVIADIEKTFQGQGRRESERLSQLRNTFQ